MRTAVLIICCLLLSFGCSMVRTGKRVYKEYLNTSPTVDLTSQAGNKCAPPAFASLFVPVDTRLNALKRDLSLQETYPPDQWFDRVMQSYPWLESLVAVNTKGEVLAQRLKGEVKQFDYKTLCAGEWKKRQPRAAFVKLVSRTDISLTMPFFKNNTWKGCFVASFSPSDLVRYCPRKESLVILTPQEGVLWPGHYADKIDTLVDQPWASLLKERVSGEITAYGQRFFWMGRAFAGTWLIYTSRVSEN